MVHPSCSLADRRSKDGHDLDGSYHYGRLSYEGVNMMMGNTITAADLQGHYITTLDHYGSSA